MALLSEVSVVVYIIHNNECTRFKGRGERLGSGHSQHLQRAPRLSHLLADIRHYGSANVRRQILQGKKCKYRTRG